ncbi:2-C-methyl-D-erythritol 2,4-cyclodiphosphate synthase [Entomobacter blattae]|uniref:Bifunctional enzyme IspD/IspF n=1 Tax=Entomobacter blattae TaxID=2762277 RepID=A0A7H1NT60_9PROT|nr:2-C-methyl-D-erythritol 2,4-cyclodiphosphate synthase [Entomobacter blattae]QNT78970.1 Bifunctional enzyme IspD/IspF [Entomobacter blattae]
MKIAAIVLAAGSGQRFNTNQAEKKLKQYTLLAGKPVIYHATKALLPYVGVVQPVGDPERLLPALSPLQTLAPVAGGQTRQESVRAGLEALAALPASLKPDFVLIHDGARPYVSAQLIENVLSALNYYKGVIPSLVVADTLKLGQSDPPIIQKTIPRENLYRAQTPQGFDFAILLSLHRQKGENSATDDALLMEEAGYSVALVKGDEDNIKLTHREDLMRLERLFNLPYVPRIGMGYDVHAFAPDRPLIICGIKIPFEKGLAGHSDADVGLHALCDAIYGALAEGDIGRHFPPSKDDWKNADSRQFLIHARELIQKKQGRLINADITLICERPKIGPHAEHMRQVIADLLQISLSCISVKATTSEKLGFTGREEGIACQACVSILVPDTETDSTNQDSLS